MCVAALDKPILKAHTPIFEIGVEDDSSVLMCFMCGAYTDHRAVNLQCSCEASRGTSQQLTRVKESFILLAGGCTG